MGQNTSVIPNKLDASAIDNDTIQLTSENKLFAHNAPSKILFKDFSGFMNVNKNTKTAETADIPASSLVNVDYLEVVISGHYQFNTNSTNTSGQVNLNLEVKDLLGSYSSIFNDALCQSGQNGGSGPGDTFEADFVTSIIRTLTEDEKTNGVKFQFTITASTTPTTALGTFKYILIKKMV